LSGLFLWGFDSQLTLCHSGEGRNPGPFSYGFFGRAFSGALGPGSRLLCLHVLDERFGGAAFQLKITWVMHLQKFVWQHGFRYAKYEHDSVFDNSLGM
jgi:hypothetical protein